MPTTFTPADFEQAQAGPRSMAVYRARVPLDNPLGPFEIELNAPPDSELLGHVNALVAAVSNDYDTVLGHVYENYLLAAENKHWMKACEVPSRLRDNQVMQYVRSRSISVRRSRNGSLDAEVFISPKWDQEHGLRLALIGGQLAPVPR